MVIIYSLIILINSLKCLFWIKSICSFNKSTLKFKAVCIAVDLGLFKSEVLSTLPSPIVSSVIPLIVPVNVGFTKGAFKSCAVCVALDIGLGKA